MGKGSDWGFSKCLCCCLIVLLCLGLLALGISKIVIGAIYLHDCELESMIPIYLIVSGAAPVLFGGFGGKGAGEGCNIATIIGIIGFLFNVVWLVCGSTWVYTNYGRRYADDYVPCTEELTRFCVKYCDETLLQFSFAMVTVDWICMALMIISALYRIRNQCTSN